MKFNFVLLVIISFFSSITSAQMDFLKDFDTSSRSLLAERSPDDRLNGISRFRWKDLEFEITSRDGFSIECKKNGSWRYEIDANVPIDPYGWQRIRGLFSSGTDKIYLLYPPIIQNSVTLMNPTEKKINGMDNLFTLHMISVNGDMIKKEVKLVDIRNGSGKVIDSKDLLSVSHMICHGSDLSVGVIIKNKDRFEFHMVKVDKDLGVTSFLVDDCPMPDKNSLGYDLNLVKVENDIVWMVESRSEDGLGSFELKQINLTEGRVVKTTTCKIDLSEIKLRLASNGMNYTGSFSTNINSNFQVNSTAGLMRALVSSVPTEKILNTRQTLSGELMTNSLHEKIQNTKEEIDISYFSNCTINEDQLFIYGFDGRAEDSVVTNIWYVSFDLNSNGDLAQAPKLINLNKSYDAISHWAPYSLCYGHLKDELFVFRILDVIENDGQQSVVEQFVEIPMN